MVRVRDR